MLAKNVGTMKSKQTRSDYLQYIEHKVVENISMDPIFIKVIDELKIKSNYSEFELAEKLNIDMKLLRRILYILFEQGLLFWRRKKDRQKGWYIYYWTLKEEQFPFYYKKILLDKLNHLEKKLENESNNSYFMCPNFCMRVDYVHAIELNFSCPECGAVLVEQDNSRTLENLKKKISEIKKELVKLEKSNLLRKIAKNFDQWYSSGNLFSKTKKRVTNVEVDFLEALMSEIGSNELLDLSNEED